MELAQLEVGVRDLRRQLDRQVGEARSVAQRGKSAEAEVERLRRECDLYEQAGSVLTSIGEQRQLQAQQRIEAIVTHGLRTIFGEDLSFHLVSSVARKQAITEFVVRSKLANGEVVDTPVMDARGGGLAAVVGFLVRLIVVLLSKNRFDPLLVLDETFAHLSEDYEPRLAEFLRELVDRTNLQIVLVTHSSAFTDAADRVYRFALEGGETRVVAG